MNECNNLNNCFKQMGKVTLQFDINTKTSLILNSTDKICENLTIDYLKNNCDIICKNFKSNNYTLFNSSIKKDDITIYLSIIPIYSENNISKFCVLSDYTISIFTNDEVKQLFKMADHDSLNSLSLINMANERILAKGDSSLLSYCNIIKENVYKIIKQKNRSKNLTTLFIDNTDNNAKQNIEISTFVESHCDSVNDVIEDANICFENTGNCYATVDTSLLSSAILNLISNAIKYKSHDSKIKVSVSKTYTYVKITISNKTAEVTKNNIKKIFNFGYTTADKITTQGNGYGLYLVDKIAKFHNGKLSAKLDEDVFSITLYLPNSKLHKTELSSYVPNLEPTNIRAFFVDIN